MEKKQQRSFGKSKRSFKDQKEYAYGEALEKLGPCRRRTMNYGTVDQRWDNGCTPTSYDDTYVPAQWRDIPCTKVVRETYDVWVNEQGDMLLAQPL